MKENKWYNIHIEANYKKEKFIILNKKKIKDTKFKSNNIPKNYLFNNKNFLYNSKLYKVKAFRNNNFLLMGRNIWRVYLLLYKFFLFYLLLAFYSLKQIGNGNILCL